MEGSTFDSPEKYKAVAVITKIVNEMPEGSKRRSVGRYITNFHRALKLIEKTHLYSQAGQDISLYDGIRYQLYLLGMFKDKYKALYKQPRFEGDLNDFVNNYFMAKIGNLEKTLKQEKYVVEKLGGKNAPKIKTCEKIK